MSFICFVKENFALFWKRFLTVIPYADLIVSHQLFPTDKSSNVIFNQFLSYSWTKELSTCFPLTPVKSFCCKVTSYFDFFAYLVNSCRRIIMAIYSGHMKVLAWYLIVDFSVDRKTRRFEWRQQTDEIDGDIGEF